MSPATLAIATSRPFDCLSQGERCGREMHRAQVVQLHQVLVRRQVIERIEARPHRAARVIDEYVEPSKTCYGGVDESPALGRIEQIGGYCDRHAAARGTFVREFLQALPVARCEHQVQAAIGKLECQGPADAFRRTGQHHHLTSERTLHACAQRAVANRSLIHGTLSRRLRWEGST